ncbi:MAG: thiol:disulfide interchange protein DsbA/DsbL [Burkholderiaceae bacterium]
MITRREFSAAATAALALAALGRGAPAWAQAAGAAPVEGRDYVRLNSPVAVPAGGKIDVIEFFSYGCPHCYSFEPMLEQWVKRLPPDVAFRRVPATFNPTFEGYARLFYALEAIGQVEALHKRVFAAIHVQRQRLDKEADIAAFVTANGSDGAKAVEAMKSFGVATKLRQAKQAFEAYKIDGVPTLGIHGSWFTSGSLTGSNDKALAVADQLIQRARKGG